MDKIQVLSMISTMVATIMTISSTFIIVSTYAQSTNFCVKGEVSHYCSPFVDLCRSVARKLGGTCVPIISNLTTSPPP